MICYYITNPDATEKEIAEAIKQYKTWSKEC
jgi:t-SNARE complex subunit (syntaxin)